MQTALTSQQWRLTSPHPGGASPWSGQTPSHPAPPPPPSLTDRGRGVVKLLCVTTAQVLFSSVVCGTSTEINVLYVVLCVAQVFGGIVRQSEHQELASELKRKQPAATTSMQMDVRAAACRDVYAAPALSNCLWKHQRMPKCQIP